MMRAFAILTLLNASGIGQIAAPLADPRVQVLPYEAQRVVRLRVPVGFQTAIILDANERVETLAVGNSDDWQVTVTQRRDYVFVKPLRANGSTNLTIVTDVRLYVFELLAAPSPTVDAPFTLRFTYPEPTIGMNAEPQPRLQVGRYRVSGDRSIQPNAVSDDGQKTYIEWSADQQLPAIFAIDDRRREMLVDGHVRDGRYVIDAVYPTLIFRLDRQTARAMRLAEERRP